MKKVIAIVCAALLLLSMAACSSSAKKDKYVVGVCQLVPHEALDAATNGFCDALKEALGEENVEIKIEVAAGDSNTCAPIVNAFVADKVDLIMANATPALQAAAAATADIPILGTSVTEYGVALGIENFSGTVGGNISGTSDLAPLDQQADMITEWCPDAKAVGLLYCSAEANSKYQATEVTKALKELGIEAKEYTSADSNDLASVVTTACAEVDVIYSPTDNTMASNTEIVNNIAEPAKVPVVAGEVGICKGCGVATLSIDYYSIGKKAGEMAYEILVNGAKPGDMEIEYADELTKQYMASRCQTLGITVPDTYVAIEEE